MKSLFFEKSETQPSMALLLAFVVLSISVSFICSILEAVLLSITPSFIASLKEPRPRLYNQLKHLKDFIDQPLAAILTLNTVAHTFGAAGVGAQVGIVFGDGYLAVASAIMTFLVLVFSEIVPKTLGARYWDRLAYFLPMVMNVLILLLKPFIVMADFVTRIFGAAPPKTDIRNEIKALTTLGLENDMLDRDEQRVISNILDLHEVKLKDIMTPRTVCEYMSMNDTIASIADKIRELGFSRYPVMDNEEHPQGIIFRSDVLDADSNTELSELVRPVLIMTEDKSAEATLSKLMSEHQHMCMVYDDYGTWLGIVTMEDILETILGVAIMDETDDIPNMRRHAKRRWEHRLKNR